MTGKWKIKYYFNGQFGGTMDVKLKQKGESLIVHYKAPTGILTGQWVESTGKIKGNKITLDFSGQKSTAIYRGTVRRTTMKGTIDMGDPEQRGSWTAEKY